MSESTATQASSAQNDKNTEKTWEIAIVVVFVLVIGAIIGALLFVRRRRDRAHRNRQTLRLSLERRNRVHLHSAEMPVLAPELSKPAPALSSKASISKFRGPTDIESQRVSV